MKRVVCSPSMVFLNESLLLISGFDSGKKIMRHPNFVNTGVFVNAKVGFQADYHVIFLDLK